MLLIIILWWAYMCRVVKATVIAAYLITLYWQSLCPCMVAMSIMWSHCSCENNWCLIFLSTSNRITINSLLLRRVLYIVHILSLAHIVYLVHILYLVHTSFWSFNCWLSGWWMVLVLSVAVAWEVCCEFAQTRANPREIPFLLIQANFSFLFVLMRGSVVHTGSETGSLHTYMLILINS